MDADKDATAQDVPLPVTIAPSPASETKHAIGKRRAKGFCSRRLTGLKIEAAEDDERRPSSNSDSSGQVAGASSIGESANTDAGDAAAVPWWQLEYRAPPPGHLGAHTVPVAEGESVDPKATTHTLVRHRIVRKNSIEMTERKMEQMEVTSSEKVAVYETPERAQRRAALGYDAAPNHSSPNQKRKIIDLLDYDGSSAQSSTHITKEPKRFHEASSDQRQHDTGSQAHKEQSVNSKPTATTVPKLDAPTRTAQPLLRDTSHIDTSTRALSGGHASKSA